MSQKCSRLRNCFRKLCCCCKKHRKYSSSLPKSKQDSSLLLQPLRRRIDYFNLQMPSNDNKDLILIWLDEQIDFDLENTVQMKNLLEQINEHVHFFSNKEEFFNYLSTITNERLFVILSGQFSIDVLPMICDKQEIHALYIFCFEDDRYKHLIDHHSKLRGVFTDHKYLIVDRDDSNQRLIVKMIAVNEAEKLANTFIQTIKDKKKSKGYLDGLISDFVHKLGYQKGLELYHHFLTLSIDNRQRIMNNCSRYLKLYEKCCDISNVVILYGCFGWFFTQRAEYDLAIEYSNRALSLVEKNPSINNIDIELAMIHNTIGWSYYEKEDYGLALEWCQRAKKMFEDCPYIEYSKYAKVLRSEEKLRQCSSRNDAEYAEILTNIGSIYWKTNHLDMAMTYCKKSMKILENLDTQMVFSDPHQTTASNKELDNHHETIAANYEVFADIDYQNGNYLRALDYYKKALNIFETITPRIPICLQRSPVIFGRNTQRLQNSIRVIEQKIVADNEVDHTMNKSS